MTIEVKIHGKDEWKLARAIRETAGLNEDYWLADHMTSWRGAGTYARGVVDCNHSPGFVWGPDTVFQVRRELISPRESGGNRWFGTDKYHVWLNSFNHPVNESHVSGAVESLEKPFRRKVFEAFKRKIINLMPFNS